MALELDVFLLLLVLHPEQHVSGHEVLHVLFGSNILLYMDGGRSKSLT